MTGWCPLTRPSSSSFVCFAPTMVQVRFRVGIINKQQGKLDEALTVSEGLRRARGACCVCVTCAVCVRCVCGDFYVAVCCMCCGVCAYALYTCCGVCADMYALYVL